MRISDEMFVRLPEGVTAVPNDLSATTATSFVAQFLCVAMTVSIAVVLIVAKSGTGRQVPSQFTKQADLKWASAVGDAWLALKDTFNSDWTYGMGFHFGQSLIAVDTLGHRWSWCDAGDGVIVIPPNSLVAGSRVHCGDGVAAGPLFDELLELQDVFSPCPEDDDVTDVAKVSCSSPIALRGEETDGSASNAALLIPAALAEIGFSATTLVPRDDLLSAERPWLVEFGASTAPGVVAPISWVHASGAGRRLGLRRGDRIMAINGIKADTITSTGMAAALATIPVSTVTSLTVFRREIEGRTRFA